MKKDLTELVVIIDESGSMGMVVNDTIGGFNTFLDTHKNLPGEANLTLVKFDTKYTLVHNGVNVKDVPELNKETYTPGGMTALLDAVGKTIDEVGRRLADTPEDERPEQVIVMIITDGEENSSKEYTKEQIKQKTEIQEKTYDWQFLYLGADQDAWANAKNIGISNSVNFKQSDIYNTINSTTLYSAKYRTTKKVDIKDYDLSVEETNKQLKDLIS